MIGKNILYNLNKSDRNKAIANESVFVEYLHNNETDLTENEYYKFLDNVVRK